MATNNSLDNKSAPFTVTSGDLTVTSGNAVIGANLTLPATASSSLGVITVGGNPFLHGYSQNTDFNIFIGQNAGNFTLTGGSAIRECGVGALALNGLTTGSGNTACGYAALTTASTSPSNSAFGSQSLTAATTGTGQNTALGFQSGYQLLTGANNVLVGYQAGSNYTGSESSNICIGSGVSGTVGESNVTRIGTQGSGAGQQNACVIAGITGVTVTGSAVLCSTVGQLGTIASAERYKDNIVDMGDESSVIYKFRPVNFTYKNDLSKHKQWGLIAEEVEKVYPELCIYDEREETKGELYSVRYLDLIPMLLNELQKLRKEFDTLKGV